MRLQEFVHLLLVRADRRGCVQPVQRPGHLGVVATIISSSRHVSHSTSGDPPSPRRPSTKGRRACLGAEAPAWRGDGERFRLGGTLAKLQVTAPLGQDGTRRNPDCVAVLAHLYQIARGVTSRDYRAHQSALKLLPRSLGIVPDDAGGIVHGRSSIFIQSVPGSE